MDKLKNRAAAACIAAVIMIISLLAGVHISVDRQIKKLEASFVNGVEFDGYVHPSVQTQLDARADAALGIISIIGEDSSLAEKTIALRNSRNDLLEAETITEKFAANEVLERAYQNAADYLKGALEYSSDALSSYMSTMENAQHLIENSGYNELARELEKQLESFPVSVLKGLAFAGSPELFA